MSLIRWSPSLDPFQEMEEIMKNFPSMQSNNLQKGFVPAMDVYEDKNAIIIETPLAGVRPEDVEVSIEKGVLTVKGESKKEHEVDEKNYYRKETRSGSFFRQIALPTAIKEDGVKAEFEDGVLKITCPKATLSKVKKINVKVIKKSIDKK